MRYRARVHPLIAEIVLELELMRLRAVQGGVAMGLFCPLRGCDTVEKGSKYWYKHWYRRI